jgi:hypothetical protein
MKSLTSKLFVAAALLIVSLLFVPSLLTLRARGTASVGGPNTSAAIVATSVPEAASLLVLGASLAGLGAVIRRRLSAKRDG